MKRFNSRYNKKNPSPEIFGYLAESATLVDLYRKVLKQLCGNGYCDQKKIGNLGKSKGC